MIGCTLFTELCGRDMWTLPRLNLQIILNAHINPYLNEATPKKYLPNLSF